MNHWYTVDQPAAGHLADLKREAAGDVRMRATVSAAGLGHAGDPTASRRRLTLELLRIGA